jgi:hypothetical protein
LLEVAAVVDPDSCGKSGEGIGSESLAIGFNTNPVLTVILGYAMLLI